MDINVITELINTMGFPIVMVGYFIWDKYKSTSKLIEVINNNNMLLNKLLIKLGAEELSDEVEEVV